MFWGEVTFYISRWLWAHDFPSGATCLEIFDNLPTAPLGNLVQGDLRKIKECVWVDGALGSDSAMWLQRTEFSLDFSSLRNESSRSFPSRIKRKILWSTSTAITFFPWHFSPITSPIPSFFLPFLSLLREIECFPGLLGRLHSPSLTVTVPSTHQLI